MKLWTVDVHMRVIALAKTDREYQLLLQRCREMELDYLHILEKLPEEERLSIDDYVASCEDLQYRLTQLAYEVGSV